MPKLSVLLSFCLVSITVPSYGFSSDPLVNATSDRFNYCVLSVAMDYALETCSPPETISTAAMGSCLQEADAFRKASLVFLQSQGFNTKQSVAEIHKVFSSAKLATVSFVFKVRKKAHKNCD